MKRFLLLIVFLSFTEALFAWGAIGHRVVAQICYDHLSEKAKMRIHKALGDDYLTQIATWPDFIRSEPNWNFAKPWHQINIESNLKVKQVVERTSRNDSIENVVEAIEFMSAILRNDSGARNKFQQLMDANDVEPLSGSMDATAIAFLVHFIGDIHQPMHVGTGNDWGGNLVPILFFSEVTNLHSVWDEGMIQQEKLSFTELAAFVNMHMLPMKEEWENDEIEEWTEESVTERKLIYSALDGNIRKKNGIPDLSYQYQHDFITVVEKRLGAAGFRAAALFNSIFK